MHRGMKITRVALLAVWLVTIAILAGCTAAGDAATSASLPSSSAESSSVSRTSAAPAGTPASRSRPATSSVSSEAAASSSTSSEAPNRGQSSSVAPVSSAPATPQPAVQAPASSQPPAQPAPPAAEPPAPPPAASEPPPAPSVDIDSVIAQGHAYAAARNMAVSSTSPSCLGPIDTDGRTTESVLALLYAQFDAIYAAMLEIPEYDPNTVVPCYNLTVSGSVIYLYFG